MNRTWSISYWLTVLWLTTTASAFEPYNVREDPQEIPNFDHLQPIDRAVPEFRYLAQYWVEARESTSRRYVVVLHDEPSGRYYVEQGVPPKSARILDKPYRFAKRAEISVETANLIYEFWVNVLLETHYDRKSLSVVQLGGTTRTFSTFVWNLGYLHGCIVYSTSNDLPPDWISDAGEALFDYVTKAARDEKELEKRILADRDKFYEYMKSLDRQRKTPSPEATPGKN